MRAKGESWQPPASPVSCIVGCRESVRCSDGVEHGWESFLNRLGGRCCGFALWLGPRSSDAHSSFLWHGDCSIAEHFGDVLGWPGAPAALENRHPDNMLPSFVHSPRQVTSLGRTPSRRKVYVLVASGAVLRSIFARGLLHVLNPRLVLLRESAGIAASRISQCVRKDTCSRKSQPNTVSRVQTANSSSIHTWRAPQAFPR
eukprot:366229-Chlamydomonas_euryale.AAC.49